MARPVDSSPAQADNRGGGPGRGKRAGQRWGQHRGRVSRQVLARGSSILLAIVIFTSNLLTGSLRAVLVSRN
jgi:hypothetical protein